MRHFSDKWLYLPIFSEGVIACRCPEEQRVFPFANVAHLQIAGLEHRDAMLAPDFKKSIAPPQIRHKGIFYAISERFIAVVAFGVGDNALIA